MLLIAAESKTKLVAITIVFTLLGVFLAFFIKPTYSARALIMPPQAPQSSLSSLLGQLGSLSSLGGGASSLLKNPADLYVGILQSETIANQAISTFHLQDRWHTKSMYETRKRLEGHIQFEAAKNGLIEITAKDDNPQKTSDLANFYVDALYQMNSTLAISEASQRRLFFEQQLSNEKSALESAEVELKNTQQKTGIITVTGQAQLAVQTIAQTEAQIASKEIQLQAIRAYGTEDNPDVVRLKEEIATQQRQLSTLEDNQRRMAPGDTQIGATQFPAGSLDYVRRLRDVKYHEILFEVLSRQYEAARVDEAKAAPIIQVIDRAIPPDHKSGPPRLLIMIGFAVCGFLLAYGWVFLTYTMEQARQTPAVASKLNRLRTQLTWHRT
ncbi:GumC family protein [Tunturibacter empetritectus]|uniref:Uncharacterized protein involved in exopolysaccharide biosynthesis n=1 Tax=Tunturiibacter lichenicola TaxID=2051959 RepID=A0A7W8N3Q9_9BACT|nr:Wzz/FepE/Etk N-terminal domain-containing protein [Edaphobacter lichenicola]MBB5344762.1 uncharacterized protein involved in exopolysaccharide biosynthesis [Edaphobacter lichenicola]